MMSPVFYFLLWPPVDPFAIAAARLGIGLAWLGILLQSVADGKQFVKEKKQRLNENNQKKEDFCKENSSGGTYHFAGEMMFWLGIWFVGLPSFCRSLTASAYGSVVLIGVCTLVLALGMHSTADEIISEEHSLKRPFVDERSYKARSPSPVVPFVHSSIPPSTQLLRLKEWHNGGL
jgi:hypothetical protein